MNKLQEFNPQIKMLFEENNIGVDDGLSYLLSLYYNLDSSVFSESLKRKIFILNIFFKNYEKNEIEWNIPLFTEIDEHFEWVNEYRDLFKNANSTRAGSKQVVIKRMKKLFSLYPHIRKDDIIEATKLYLSEIRDYTYITTAERFLFKDKDGSPILDYIERYRENDKLKSEEIYNDLI